MKTPAKSDGYDGGKTGLLMGLYLKQSGKLPTGADNRKRKEAIDWVKHACLSPCTGVMYCNMRIMQTSFTSSTLPSSAKTRIKGLHSVSSCSKLRDDFIWR